MSVDPVVIGHCLSHQWICGSNETSGQSEIMIVVCSRSAGQTETSDYYRLSSSASVGCDDSKRGMAQRPTGAVGRAYDNRSSEYDYDYAVRPSCSSNSTYQSGADRTAQQQAECSTTEPPTSRQTVGVRAGRTQCRDDAAKLSSGYTSSVSKYTTVCLDSYRSLCLIDHHRHHPTWFYFASAMG